MLSQQGSRVVLRTVSGGEAAENDVTSSAEARMARDLDTAGADAGHADPVAAAQGWLGC
ncbi:hypothetical protein [Streptomyces sp. IBSBF 2806]|uniref:hypothetical protein n=1 Tax=Streptomyces sp. IBSBF 2806 TaxID=2903529 RepID=UPI003FA74EBB